MARLGNAHSPGFALPSPKAQSTKLCPTVLRWATNCRGSLGTLCLLCRRGSNVSLVLDMSSLGSVEPIQPVCTPRDVTLQFLRTSSHVLRTEELQQRAQSLAQLQEEFSV